MLGGFAKNKDCVLFVVHENSMMMAASLVEFSKASHVNKIGEFVFGAHSVKKHQIKSINFNKKGGTPCVSIDGRNHQFFG